jgi:hypothetical protein
MKIKKLADLGLGIGLISAWHMMSAHSKARIVTLLEKDIVRSRAYAVMELIMVDRDPDDDLPGDGMARATCGEGTHVHWVPLTLDDSVTDMIDSIPSARTFMERLRIVDDGPAADLAGMGLDDLPEALRKMVESVGGTFMGVINIDDLGDAVEVRIDKPTYTGEDGEQHPMDLDGFRERFQDPPVFTGGKRPDNEKDRDDLMDLVNLTQPEVTPFPMRRHHTHSDIEPCSVNCPANAQV